MTSAQLEVDLGANSPLEALNAYILKKMIIFILISESLKTCIPMFFGSTVSRATQSMEKYYRKNVFGLRFSCAPP